MTTLHGVQCILASSVKKLPAQGSEPYQLAQDLGDHNQALELLYGRGLGPGLPYDMQLQLTLRPQLTPACEVAV